MFFCWCYVASISLKAARWDEEKYDDEAEEENEDKKGIVPGKLLLHWRKTLCTTSGWRLGSAQCLPACQPQLLSDYNNNQAKREYHQSSIKQSRTKSCSFHFAQMIKVFPCCIGTIFTALHKGQRHTRGNGGVGMYMSANVHR